MTIKNIFLEKRKMFFIINNYSFEGVFGIIVSIAAYVASFPFGIRMETESPISPLINVTAARRVL